VGSEEAEYWLVPFSHSKIVLITKLEDRRIRRVVEKTVTSWTRRNDENTTSSAHKTEERRS
jgi:hypothetical protein